MRQTLVVDKNGPVAHVWLNRPECRNALNQQMLDEITEVFDSLQKAFEVRVVILGGNGPTFCAGADRKETAGTPRMLGTGTPARERRWLAEHGVRVIEAIETLDAVTIARVHGHAIGGGILLALACDLRVAAEGTSFWFPELGLGSPLDWTGVPRLIREVGPVRAREIVLTCKRFDAHDAERYGLLNQVVPQGELDAIVSQWTSQVLRTPDTVVQMTKAQFRAYSAVLPLGDVTQFEAELFMAAMAEEAAQKNFGSK